MKKKHPGFAKVQSSIMKKEGVSKERAGAMLAASTRRASPEAKKKNPDLKHVKMPMKHEAKKSGDPKINDKGGAGKMLKGATRSAPSKMPSDLENRRMAPAGKRRSYREL